MTWKSGLPGWAAAVSVVACLAWAPTPAVAGDLIARFHGNYCGYDATDPTFRKRPIDALDAACRRHDRCYRKRQASIRVCDARLATEAGRLVNSRRVSAEVRRKAGLIELVFAFLSF